MPQTKSLVLPPAVASDATPWVSADRVTKLCLGHLLRATAIREAVKTKVLGDRTPGNTLLPLNELDRDLDTANGWAGLMKEVHPEAAVRTAAQECQQKLSAFAQESAQDRGLYEAIADADLSGADAQTKRFVERSLLAFRRAGVDKDDATRARLAEIHARLTVLKQNFGQNVREDTRYIELASKDALNGLPPDFVAAHLPKGTGDKLRVSTNYTDFYPVQRYAKDAGLRKDLYAKFLQRGFPTNKPVLEEILRLRHEYATLLGFEHWASYNAEDKMVKTSQTVDGFLQDLAKLVRPRMEADLKTLLERKRLDLPKAEKIQAWDRFFYTREVREKTFNFDTQEVRKYFQYSAVKDGILALYAELFGLEFSVIKDAPVWHPSVEAFEMRADGKVVGQFYFDMHPRDDKYKHAAMFTVRTGLASGRTPVGTLVCNFPNPAEGDHKALMEHSDVVTFFHEFGHLIHHLLARNADWISLAGINVEWDFVETPSQILEEWAWDPAVLARFTKHVDTGKPIPPELVERMRGADEFGKGAAVMRQIFYAAFSFYLHTRDPADIDLEAFTTEMQAAYSPYPRVPGGHTYANFGHLTGYSSMYYTYQWSLSIAKDMYTQFAKAGLLDREVAMRYRRKILEPGATKDAADLVEDFLGRPYELQAYRDWLQK